jgi:hypothetical protein
MEYMMAAKPTTTNNNDAIFEVYLTTLCLGSGIQWDLACFTTRRCGQSSCWWSGARLVECIWLCVIVGVIICLVFHVQQVVDSLFRRIYPGLEVLCALLG